MKIILTLPIDQTQRIEISVPEIDRKINYFYPVSESLHKFDEATISYICNDEHTILKEGALGAEILITLVNFLKIVLQYNHELPKKIKPGKLGFAWCEFAENLPEDYNDYSKADNIYPKFWLLSGIEVQTWIYNSNQKIVLEISPNYKWSLDEPKEGDICITYQEFIKNYKPIAVIELSEKTVRNWLKKCQELLDQLKNN